jgi:hypothetical protein
MKRALISVLGLTLLVAGANLVMPTAAAAQDCWECHTDPHDDDLHWDGDGFYEAYPPDYMHASKGVGSCGDSHQIPICPPAPAALELLVDAITARDIDAVVDLYSSLDGRALLNAERQAIQITSCSDESIILVHLPIDETSFDSIAAAVAAIPASAELSPRKQP